MAWRWQSDAASPDFHRIDSWWTFTACRRTAGLRFAAACMASRKAWYRDAQEELYRPKQSNHIDRVFRFALHLHRGDYTNTVVSRRTKLHNCETMSMNIVLDVDKKTTGGFARDDPRHMRHVRHVSEAAFRRRLWKRSRNRKRIKPMA